MSDEALPHIRCGCGFEAVGTDEAANVKAYEAHGCTADSSSWLELVFTWQGLLIVLTLAIAAVAIVDLVARGSS